MSMRISSTILLAFALPACGPQTTGNETLAKVEAQQRTLADDDGLIECAANGSGVFKRSCTVDRTESDRGLVLTVRHDNGAFHRLLVTTDGRGVIAADGAEKAVVTVLDADHIEVALGRDRYRLPATVKGSTNRT